MRTNSEVTARPPTTAPQRTHARDLVLGYCPSLDGLRGISILAVVIVHASLPDIRANGVGAAFVGVNTFFVLSGFLLTSLLLQEWNQLGRISLKKFYARRALRLLPALALVLTTFVLRHYIFGTKKSGLDALYDALIPACYVSNWTRALGLDRPVLFAHTWSLSIEEQFYFCWPLTLVLLLRRTSSRSSLIHWLILSIFVVVVSRLLLVTAGATAERILNGTDTRADSLLLGCLLAAVLSSGFYPEASSFRSLVRYAAWASAVLLVLLAFRRDFNRHFAEKMLFFVCSLCAGVVILEVVTADKGLLSKVLSQSWLVYIGKISYGLYLWHAAIFREVFSRGWSRETQLFIAISLTAVATLVSYYFLERPILEYKKKFARITPKP